MGPATDPLLPGATHTVAIESLGFGGEGITTLDGLRAVVPHALPGEIVVVEVVRVPERGAVRTRLRRVVQASADRVDPACAAWDRCPGCHLRHVPYAVELEAKRRSVTDAVVRFAGGEAACVEAVRAAPSRDGYRARASGVPSPAGPSMPGIAPDDPLVPLADCPVLTPALRRAAAATDAPADEDGRIRLAEPGAPAGWTLPNPSMAPVVARTVLELLGALDGARVLEVGCGNGGLTAVVAPRAGHVVGLDLDRAALAAATERAEAAGYAGRFTARAGRVDKVWRRLVREHGAFDAALVNPMRRPLGAAAMAALVQAGARRCVYVGPSPVPTCRDLAHLAAAGLVLRRCVPVDLYPGTYHVLTVASLSG